MPARVSVQHVHVWCSQRPEEGVRFPETGATGEPNGLAGLKEKPGLLIVCDITPAPSLFDAWLLRLKRPVLLPTAAERPRPFPLLQHW